MADLIPSPDKVAETIIEQQFKGYTDKLSKEERKKFLEEMKAAAKESIKLKLDSINTSWVALQESLAALSNIPTSLVQGIASAATLMPPPAGTTVLVSQLTGDIPVWQAQAADANAKVAVIKGSLAPLSALPVIAPFMAPLDAVAATVSSVQAALGAIPL